MSVLRSRLPFTSGKVCPMACGNALLSASTKEAASTSNFHPRLARSHRVENFAHFDRSELKTAQSQIRSEMIHIVGLR